MPQDELQSSVSFSEIAEHVFGQAKNGTLLIGGQPIPAPLRETLRDEAEYIIKSRLWEILNAAVMNEEYRLGMLEAKEWEHVRFAKALHHWAQFFRNTLFTLAKPTK